MLNFNESAGILHWILYVKRRKMENFEIILTRTLELNQFYEHLKCLWAIPFRIILPLYLADFHWQKTTHSLSQLIIIFKFADFSVQNYRREKSINFLGFWVTLPISSLNSNSGRVVLVMALVNIWKNAEENYLFSGLTNFSDGKLSVS